MSVTGHRDGALEGAESTGWSEGAAAWRRVARAIRGDVARGDGGGPSRRCGRRGCVLDIASGTGEPALALAAAVAPGGAVVATDLVAEMLTDIGELARQAGLTSITARRADAEALPFEDR
ncbi:MAG: methyltransferase domain-containing protein [Chloroflexia bacterium]